MGEAGFLGDPERLRWRVIERSARDEAFRERLLADPRAAVQEETGVRLPEGLEIRLLEETPNTIYLVLPPEASASRGDGQLSDADLESVAGGFCHFKDGYFTNRDPIIEIN